MTLDAKVEANAAVVGAPVAGWEATKAAAAGMRALHTETKVGEAELMKQSEVGRLRVLAGKVVASTVSVAIVEVAMAARVA